QGDEEVPQDVQHRVVRLRQVEGIDVGHALRVAGCSLRGDGHEQELLVVLPAEARLEWKAQGQPDPPHLHAVDLHGCSRADSPGARVEQRRHKPKMWWRWPAIVNPRPAAISSCRRSISGLLNSKMAPQDWQMKWSWCARFQSRSNRDCPSSASSLASPADCSSFNVR